MSIDFEAIRREHSVLDVLAGIGWAGTPRPGYLAGPCPLPDNHSTRTDVFTATPAGYRGKAHDEWHCFSCDRGGDVVDLVMALHGCSLVDAIEMLDGGRLDHVRAPGAATVAATSPRTPPTFLPARSLPPRTLTAFETC